MPSGIAAGLSLAGLAWLVLVLTWLASSERRSSQAAFRSLEIVNRELATRRLAIDRFEREGAESAQEYVAAKRRIARLTFPLEDLRELGAKNVRWTALRDAGLRNLEDVLRAGHTSLTSIPGVGDASVDRVLSAASAASEAIDRAEIPIPELGTLGPDSLRFVSAIARLRASRADAVPPMERLEEHQQSLKERADSLRRRDGMLRWLFGGRRRGRAGSLLEDSRALESLAKGLLNSNELASVDFALREITSAWGECAVSAGEGDVRRRVIDLLPGLRAELQAALTAAGGSTAVPTQRAAVLTTPPPEQSPASRHHSPRVEVPHMTPHGGPPTGWIPPGKGIEIHGYRIPSGMIYVGGATHAGTELRPDESAVIDLSLPVDQLHPDRDGKWMTYWPVYELIPPASRAAYLEWLATGRRDSTAYIGYVFLFFYGLERRLLHDALTDPQAEAETDLIIAEVKRLLGIYGENGSFREYASNFIDFAQARRLATNPAAAPSPPDFERSFQLPVAVRIGLAKFIADGRPVPSDWALAWLRADPSTHLRIPAERCRNEFDSLFRARFAAKFGDGLRVSSRSKATVLEYRTASSAFDGPVKTTIPGLPDVSGLTAPVRKLQDLAEECTEALEAYSRWIGRHPDESGTPAAAALLPAELAGAVRGQRIDALTEWAERTLSGEAAALGKARDLFALWGVAAGERLPKADAVLLAQFFEKRGFGIEPDVRFGSNALDAEGNVVVFRHDGSPSMAPSPSYSAAATLLRIGSSLAGSDGTLADHERLYLEHRLESSLGLTTTEQTRLRAHFRWLQLEEVGMAGMKKRIEALADQHDRAKVGEFLVGVAAADGRIEPEEVATLLRLFRMLQLEEDGVYTALHRLGMPGSVAPTAPVSVKAASPDPTGYAIPAPPAARAAAILLDPELVRVKLEESEAVFGILKGIFTAEEPPPPPLVQPAAGIWGLDGNHSALLRSLAEQPNWSRADFEAVAAKCTLLPDGAIETINEAAFEEHGDAFINGDDPLELQLDLLKEESA